MLSAEAKQFKLNDLGEILFQPDASNPLPGNAIACIKKGTSLLEPAIDVLGNAKQDKGAVLKKLTDWLSSYTGETLDALVNLTNGDIESDTVRDITSRLYESLGILPREELEGLISKLGEEGRRELRQRKVRLGPVLVFMPSLNKPASVRLRALLWALWNDKPLPVKLPSDGIVSYDIGEDVPDPVYYRTIGYPLYGKRAIRVDMLDRLIGSIYDSADKGQFQAKHEMAEWLGCTIPCLYEVLEAIGHKKLHDPAEEEKSKTEEDKPKTEEKEKPAEIKEPVDGQQDKPELASFGLRKGRAYSKSKPKPERVSKNFESKKVKKTYKKQKPKVKKKQPMVMSAAPENVPDNSPFAILKKLNVKGTDD